MAEETPRDERTEEATPRRRQEAREKGQVAMSTELIAGIGLSVAVGALVLGGAHLSSVTGELVVRGVQLVGAQGPRPLEAADASAILAGSARRAAGAVALVVVPLLAVGLLVGYGQVGFQIAPKALEWDLARLNPVKGLGRLFSARSTARTLSAVLKIVLIAAVMGWVAAASMPQIAALVGDELGPMLNAAGRVVLRAAVAALLVVLALALFDLFFQRFQHDRDLRMTRKEIKEEHRNSEGDPHVRARIRAIQREMASRRMMAEVPKATVVVTNPTHYAVALRYAGEEGGAPVVVAKGVDEVAQRIKTIAREHGVICFEDVPLARALHAQCDLGQEVPVDLYQAVASVLAYVYRVRGEHAA